MSVKFSLLMLIACGLSICGSANADLVITEAMSSSGNPTGPANGDWWELTNTGASDIDLVNYYWDDNGPMGNNGSLFPAINIVAGQSIVIVDEPLADLAAFVAAWGGGFTAISRDSFGGPNPFSGLASGGDQIELWDQDPNTNPLANLVAAVDFGVATSGLTFEWDRAGNSLGLSVAGENGAFVAPGNGGGGAGTNVGSPGIAPIPEPSTFAVLALVTGMATLRRRK